MAETSGWRLTDAAGVRIARCDALSALPGLAHAFSTRLGHGAGAFDLGPADGAGPETVARRAALVRAAGCRSSLPVLLHQVHGSTVRLAADLAGSIVEADGVVGRGTDAGTVPAPAVRAADCVPVLLASRDGGTFGALHAGWRGIAAGIAIEGLARLESLGTRAEALVVALGPAIGPCCYEVGEEVADAFASAGIPPRSWSRRGAGERPHADLHGALSAQLAAAGVHPEAIHRAPWCTRCRNDLFFSFRVQGRAAGRHMAVIGAGAAHP